MSHFCVLWLAQKTNRVVKISPCEQLRLKYTRYCSKNLYIYGLKWMNIILKIFWKLHIWIQANYTTLKLNGKVTCDNFLYLILHIIKTKLSLHWYVAYIVLLQNRCGKMLLVGDKTTEKIIFLIHSYILKDEVLLQVNSIDLWK